MPESFTSLREKPNLDFPTLALAVKAQDLPEHFCWAIANSFALEYTPDPACIELLENHLDPAIQAGVPIRFHGRYFGHEIGHPDSRISESAMRVHLATLEAMHQKSEPVVTFHLGLCHREPFDPDKGVINLTLLVEAAKKRGITVCLENLRRGPASHPENIAAWAKASSASITLDIGHALSCQRVQSGELLVTDFIDSFADRLYEVHIYGHESDRHYPINNMAPFEPIVDRLLETSCRWWTIELEDPLEALSTRNLLLGHLGARRCTEPTPIWRQSYYDELLIDLFEQPGDSIGL
ncbi:MAG: TIM barrel protein [Desulfatirhabdiaceae bacterium]|nr:TIM barrel protein [Desulfatirhabdiaceae bacterium]